MPGQLIVFLVVLILVSFTLSLLNTSPNTPSNTPSNIPATLAQHPINHITSANKMQVGHTFNQGYSAPVEKIGMEVEPKVTERKH